VRAMRVSFIGELGWELHASNSAALDVYNTVIEVGKEFGLRNSGYRALDSLSIEKGKIIIVVILTFTTLVNSSVFILLTFIFLVKCIIENIR